MVYGQIFIQKPLKYGQTPPIFAHFLASLFWPDGTNSFSYWVTLPNPNPNLGFAQRKLSYKCYLGMRESILALSPLIRQSLSEVAETETSSHPRPICEERERETHSKLKGGLESRTKPTEERDDATISAKKSGIHTPLLRLHPCGLWPELLHRRS